MLPEFQVGFSADFRDNAGALIFPDIGLSLLEGVPHLSFNFVEEYRPEYSPDQLRNLDVIVSLKPRISAASLQNAERLSAVGRCGVGYDNVDLAACSERDVAVFITPAGVVKPVAESIVLLVLALSHKLVLKDRLIRQGRWAESTRHLGREPRDRVIGTVGLGNIACEAVRMLKVFEPAEFLAFDPFAQLSKADQTGVRLVELDELLRRSDYVLVNCPLTTETRGMLGPREFDLMKESAFLINTARGPIVNEGALIEALQTGRIKGAALDVFEQEPLPPDSPLLTMDNVVVSSHSIAWTEELFRDMGRLDCEGALAIYRGEIPRDVVNRDVLTRPGFLTKLERYKERWSAGLP